MIDRVAGYDDQPICTWSELPIVVCAHCRGPASDTPVNPRALDALTPPARGNTRVGRTATRTPADTSTPTVVNDITYLLTHWQHLVTQDWIDDAWRDLAAVWQALRTAHGHQSPRPLGRCLNVTNGTPCPGRVYPDPRTPQPKCTVCHRRYNETDLIRLRITEERQ